MIKFFFYVNSTFKICISLDKNNSYIITNLDRISKPTCARKIITPSFTNINILHPNKWVFGLYTSL